MSSISIATWQSVLSNQQQQLSRYTSQPSVAQAITDFQAKAPTITSIDQLMSDPKLLNTVLTTYGLESEAQYPARLRALLTQDPSDPQSLVNRLVDPRYTKLVKDLSFFGGAPANLKDQDYITKFVQTYQINAFEENDLGQQDPNLREAAYFTRNIGNVTDVYQILSDKVLTDVVSKALQLPSGFGGLDVDQQASILQNRLNLGSFQDPLAKNAQLYQDATADNAQISDANKLSNAASSVVDSLNNDLGKLKNAYDALAARQDPSGANATKIADQNNYVPQLTLVRGMLDAARTRTSDLTSSIDGLTTLAQTGSTASAASLASLKSQFDSTVARLKQNLDNASYLDPSSGAAQNLLEDGSFSVTITTSPGHSFTFQGTDLSSLKSALDSAQSQIDALNVGDTIPGSVATTLAGARTQSVAAKDFLDTQQRTYNTLLENVDPNISAYQQSLVYRAASSSTDSLSRASQIADKLQQLADALNGGTATTDDNGLTVNHNLIDQQVQQLKTDIQSLITTGAGGTDNLLNGNGDYGSEGGIALSIQGIDLVKQLSDQLGNVNALTVANSQSGADLVTKTLQPLLSTLTQNLVNQSNYVQQAATSAGFAVTVDTNALAQASGSAADAIDRATQIGGALGTLQQLARNAIASGGDASAAAQVTSLQSTISDLINNVGTAGDDNLLAGGGTQGYAYIGSTQLYVRKADLANTISSAIAGIDLSTAAGAQSAYDLITNTVLPALADARTTITTDGQTVTNARYQFDGRTAVDNMLIATTSSIGDRVAGATVTVKNNARPVDDGTGTIDPTTGQVIPPSVPATVDENLLTSSADTLLFLKSVTGTYDISGHGEFTAKVTQPLVNAVNNIFKTAGAPTAAVNAAVQALTNISIDLDSDRNQLQFGTQGVADLIDQKKQFEARQAAAPYQASEAANKFVLQYLALADDSTSSQGASLASLLDGSANTTNILNLLL